MFCKIVYSFFINYGSKVQAEIFVSSLSFFDSITDYDQELATTYQNKKLTNQKSVKPKIVLTHNELLVDAN